MRESLLELSRTTSSFLAITNPPPLQTLNTAHLFVFFFARRLGSPRVHPMIALHLGGTLLFMAELLLFTPHVCWKVVLASFSRSFIVDLND